LILEKRFTELKISILTALGTGVVYLLCWYHFAGHLFRSYRGKEAISAALTLKGLVNGLVKMFNIINKEAFAGLLIAFAIVILVYIVIKVRKKEKLINYESALFLSAVSYIIVVSKIAPFYEDRYLMPVIFALFIIIYLVVHNILKMIGLQRNADYIIVILFLAINFFNLASNSFYVKMDYYSAAKNNFITTLEDKSCVVYIDDAWEALYFYLPLQHANEYIFVNEDSVDSVLESQKEDFVLVSIPSKAKLITSDLYFEELYVSGKEGYYLVDK
jgi:hypothetical protein